MKVAVSIPDDVFEEAEQLASHLQTSRSQLYARALAAFTRKHSPDRVTEAMNEVVDTLPESPSDFGRRAARRVLERTEW
jgi:metal-responsive CopG/Arc/MetJ family transcriptional regulator